MVLSSNYNEWDSSTKYSKSKFKNLNIFYSLFTTSKNSCSISTNKLTRPSQGNGTSTKTGTTFNTLWKNKTSKDPMMSKLLNITSKTKFLPLTFSKKTKSQYLFILFRSWMITSSTSDHKPPSSKKTAIKL